MSNKLRAYVDSLFEEAPTIPRVYDLKEELLANLEEKYADLIASGHSQEDAYATVITGLGDTEDLIASLTIEPEDPGYDSARQQAAQTVATSAFLYCLAIAAFLLIRSLLGATLAWVAFWVIAGFATAQTVYHYMTRPVVARRPSGMTRKQRKQVRNAVSSILWLSTVILYFVISFAFHNWALSWLIFLIAAIIEQVIHLVFKMGDEGNA
jgi:hypothetical protein